MITTILALNFSEIETNVTYYAEAVQKIKVPYENTPTNLHLFNYSLDELYAPVALIHGELRAYKDGISRFIRNRLEDAYSGRNEATRKAAGIQYVESFPSGDKVYNLFTVEHTISRLFYLSEAIIRSIEAKQHAKITSNSLLKLEKELL